MFKPVISGREKGEERGEKTNNFLQGRGGQV